MSPVVIVAIPAPDELVWRYSSEKVPHMTLLFLGDDVGEQTASRMVEYMTHAAETVLEPFYMTVDRRGELGDDSADVLFFEKGWPKSVWNFRQSLLRDTDILRAYKASDQYPEWTPHLTMGYPETPAKKDDREYPGIHGVQFDRIALWTGDYSGPTVQLVNSPPQMEVSMSSTKVEDFLAHFGIKGMKWGVRRSDKELASVSSGGDSPDGVRAKETLSKIRTSGTLTSVSNDDLNHLVNRLQLEKRFEDVNPSGLDKGHAAVKKALTIGTTMNEAITFYNSPAGQLVKNMLGLTKNSGDPTRPYGKHAKPLEFKSGGKKNKK